RCFAKIVCHPLSSSIVYAAITRAGGFPEMAAAKGHPQAAGPVGVFRSDDGGVTWAQLTNGLPALAATDLAVDPSSPSILYAAIGHIFGSSQNGIYKTTDGGVSWVKLAGGLPASGLGRINLAVAPTQPTRVYALLVNDADPSGGGASTRGAFRSDDAGATWTNLNIGDFQSTYGWYLSVVSVKPDDANTVFMGGFALMRSKNSGATWSDRTPSHVDLHALAWDAGGRLLAGDDGGVQRSGNLGDSWTARNTGLGVMQFYAGLSTHPGDELIVFGGNQDNGTNRRTTNTRQWTQVLGGDGGFTALDQHSPQRVFGEYQGSGNLYLATDGGSSFNWAGNGIDPGDRTCFVPPYVIDPINSSHMLYATHRIYRSTNGASSWTVLSGDLTAGSGAVRALAIAPADPTTVYAATNDGRVLVSRNSGSTFQLIASGVPGWPRVTRELCIDPYDAGTLYLGVAYFGTDQVRRATNYGAAWQALDGNLPDVPVNVVAADSRVAPAILYAGTDQGVYRSDDDGRTWARYGAGLPRAAVIDLVLELDRNRLIAGTQGRGAWSVEHAPCMPAAGHAVPIKGD
ncbi:MAG: hypothetical protein U1E76_21510, partial [Planctomycetota bacterium]